MKKRSYTKPKMYFTPNLGERPPSGLASMTDEDFERYLAKSRSAEYSKRYKASSDVLLRIVGDEFMLVPVGSNIEIHGLISVNKVARFLWEEFREASTIPEVLARAKEKYHDLYGDMEREIRSFVAEYNKNKFIIEENSL